MHLRMVSRATPAHEPSVALSVTVQGTIVRLADADAHASLAVAAEPLPDGPCALIPLLLQDLGAELGHFVGERLTVRGRLVNAGARRLLHVSSYAMAADVFHRRALASAGQGRPV